MVGSTAALINRAFSTYRGTLVLGNAPFVPGNEKNPSAMTLGEIILVGGTPTPDLLKQEYQHTLQARILGGLYIPLPSMRAIQLSTLLLAWLPIACTVSPIVHVYNASLVPIAFLSSGEEHRAGLGRTASFGYEWGSVSANTTDCALVYEAPRVFSDFPSGYKRLGFLRSNVYFQLASGGSLYILRPTGARPVDVATYAQPEGFPLVPQLTGECTSTP